MAPGPVILGLSHWLMFWALLGPAHNVAHPGAQPSSWLGASKIQGWALPPGPMTITPHPHQCLLEENSPVRQEFQGPQEHPIKS